MTKSEIKQIREALFYHYTQKESSKIKYLDNMAFIRVQKTEVTRTDSKEERMQLLSWTL